MSQLTAFKKKAFYSLIIFAICVIGIFGSAKLHSYGEYRTHKETRHARMIDVFDQYSESKGHKYYYTYGYFVDRETGNHFTDYITEITFKQFKKDGNKGIETSWPYSIDKTENTSKGSFSLLMAFLGFFSFTCLGFYSLSRFIFHIQNIHEFSKK